MTRSSRTINYLLQLKRSIIFKAVAVLASFMLVPVMVNYLGVDRFGIWVTLYGIISWMIFFDFGLGSGLRNKVAEALAKNDNESVGELVSTGYGLMAFVAATAFLLLAGASNFLDWQRIFNSRAVSEHEIRWAVLVFSVFFSLNFIFSLINQLLHANQKTSLTVLLQMTISVLSLGAVYLATKIFSPSLVVVSTAIGLAMLTATLSFSVGFFSRNKWIIPRIALFRSHRIREMAGVGIQFFAIQLSVLVIFTTDRVVIAQLFGPAEVAQYELVFRLYSAVTILHQMLMAPMWSAYTNAYHIGDMQWIRNALVKQMLVLVPIMGIVACLMLFGGVLIRVWVGDVAQVDPTLLVLFGILILTSCWNDVFGSLLAGMGKIRLGAIYTVVIAALNIPLSIFFAKNMSMGVPGIILGTICSIAISTIVSPLQVYYFAFSSVKSPLLTRILR